MDGKFAFDNFSMYDKLILCKKKKESGEDIIKLLFISWWFKEINFWF